MRTKKKCSGCKFFLELEEAKEVCKGCERNYKDRFEPIIFAEDEMVCIHCRLLINKALGIPFVGFPNYGICSKCFNNL